MPTNLHPEVLWHIFMMNASDQDDFAYMKMEPLDTTRSSSQVCWEWRQIILSSSKMWGRLLILNNGHRREWAKEILRRSGSAPLWVYYCDRNVPTVRMDGWSFFLQTVAKHWERVEVLSSTIFINDDYDPVELEELGMGWAFLHRPAPLLRVFSVLNKTTSPLVLCCPTHLSPRLSHKSLFSATSPLLHTFQSNFNTIHRHGHGFKNLRTLNLKLQSHPDLTGLFHSLKTTHLLESLKLETSRDYVVRNTDHSQSPIALPMLSKLTIDTTPFTFITMLDRIETPPGCSICYTIHVNGDDFVPENRVTGSILEQIVTRIPKILTNCIEHAEFTKISGLDIFFLDVITSLRSRNCVPGPDFSLSFHWYYIPKRQFNYIFPLIVQSFHCHHFEENSVTDIHLHIFSCLFENKAVQTWLHRFVSPTRLHMQPLFSLPYFIQDKGTDLFPNLHTLYIKTADMDFELGYLGNRKQEVFHLLDYLQIRIDMGRPVSTVCIAGDCMLDTSIFEALCVLLDNLDGLKVVCENTTTDEKFEYLCGRS